MRRRERNDTRPLVTWAEAQPACPGVESSECVCALAKAGFEGVRIAEPKPIELPDEALAPHMAPAGIASFRASGAALKSGTVLGTKPA
jgi:hypothetical protein